MHIELSPQLETILREHAQKKGVTPENLVVDVLRNRFFPHPLPIEPQDEWERKLLEAAIDCEVSVSHTALSSDGLYE